MTAVVTIPRPEPRKLTYVTCPQNAERIIVRLLDFLQPPSLDLSIAHRLPYLPIPSRACSPWEHPRQASLQHNRPRRRDSSPRGPNWRTAFGVKQQNIRNIVEDTKAMQLRFETRHEDQRYNRSWLGRERERESVNPQGPRAVFVMDRLISSLNLLSPF